jgi:hypothetical protein
LGDGVTMVRDACGLSRVAITKALHELDAAPLAPGRIRRPGGGRSALLTRDRTLPETLEGLVEPLAKGIRNRRCAGPPRARGSRRPS